MKKTYIFLLLIVFLSTGIGITVIDRYADEARQKETEAYNAVFPEQYISENFPGCTIRSRDDCSCAQLPSLSFSCYNQEYGFDFDVDFITDPSTLRYEPNKYSLASYRSTVETLSFLKNLDGIIDSEYFAMPEPMDMQIDYIHIFLKASDTNEAKTTKLYETLKNYVDKRYKADNEYGDRLDICLYICGDKYYETLKDTDYPSFMRDYSMSYSYYYSEPELIFRAAGLDICSTRKFQSVYEPFPWNTLLSDSVGYISVSPVDLLNMKIYTVKEWIFTH